MMIFSNNNDNDNGNSNNNNDNDFRNDNTIINDTFTTPKIIKIKTMTYVVGEDDDIFLLVVYLYESTTRMKILTTFLIFRS